MRRKREPAVPARLATDIEGALARVDDRRTRLDGVSGTGAPLAQRRRAHAELRRAFLEADALLRTATRRAKAHSHREWSAWRHRLSRLDLARQQHLFEESDDLGVLPAGSVRAVDTGMSGPAIGDLMHGRGKPYGAPATYGIDLEAALGATTAPAVEGHRTTAAGPARVGADRAALGTAPLEHQVAAA